MIGKQHCYVNTSCLVCCAFSVGKNANCELEKLVNRNTTLTDEGLKLLLDARACIA